MVIAARDRWLAELPVQQDGDPAGTFVQRQDPGDP